MTKPETTATLLCEPGWHVKGINPPSDFGPMERQMAEQYYDRWRRLRAGAVPQREFLVGPDGKVVRSEAEKAER